MLLYKKGGHFVKHTDRKKEDYMFGTLVVQLPSEYTGGEFVVYYHDMSMGTRYAKTRSIKIDFGQSTSNFLLI